MLIEIDNMLVDNTDISSAAERLAVGKTYALIRVSAAINNPIKIPSVLSKSKSKLGIFCFLDAINFSLWSLSGCDRSLDQIYFLAVQVRLLHPSPR